MKSQSLKLLSTVTFIFAFVLFVWAFTLQMAVSANEGASKFDATNRSLAPDSDRLPQNERVKQIIESSALREFDVWVRQYAGGNFQAGDGEQIKRGQMLAAERRELFKELIRLDPQAALERVIPAEAYKLLPSVIAENSEKRVSAYGDFLVYVIDEIDPTTGTMIVSRTEREVIFGDSRLKAFVFGRRNQMTTKLNIPLQGIVIDDVMAVDESPARSVAPTEYGPLAIDESKLGENGLAAQIGGEIKYFPSQSELDDFVNEQIEWESKIGPERPKGRLAPDENASTWTEGAKRVLFIRVDFPDRPGEPTDAATGLPLTPQRAQEEMDRVNTVYTNSSYGKTSFQVVTVTPVIRLPQPASFYMPSPAVMKFTEMMTDARNAARAAGYETNNFDLDVVASINNGVNFAGLGSIGGKGTWLIGYFNFGYPTHEIGHNYGLVHSSVWRTTDGTIIGQGSETGGDVFDGMAYSGYGESATHFMASDKRHLDWLIAPNVQNITNDGVYRVFAQDFPNPNNIRLLRVKKDSTRNYDVEFRQSIVSNPNAMNGAVIRWQYPQTRSAQLLDMTPNTNTFPTGLEDAPLVVGQSFFDNVNRIRITILGKGNTSPESLDVRVELNIGCTFSLGQATQNFGPGGGQGTVTVNTQSGCNPVITSSDSWISIGSSGSDSVSYTVSANATSQPRTGTINISGQIFTIQQANCTFSLGQTNQSFAASGGAGVFAVTTQTGCTLAAASNNNWISIISTGSGEINYIVAANYNPQSRTGIINVSGQTYTVQQSPASTACAPRPSGLAAWWRGEGNALDESGFNNGSVQTGMSYSAGRVGGGFKGAGTTNSNRIYVPDSPALALDRSLSIEGWLRVNAPGNYTLIVRGDDRDYHGSYAVSFFSGNFFFSVSPAPNATGISIGSSSSLPASEFVHFAGTLDDATGQMKFYINGNLVNQTVTSIRPYRDLDPTRNPRIAIGNLAHSGLSFDSFNGIIDELSVYDRALSASEVQAIYAAGTAATGATGKCLATQSPRARFDFDGDGKTDIGIFRPVSAASEWWINRSSNGQTFALQFGAPTDRIVPADYTGDGKADIAFFRPGSGEWYVLRSEDFSFFALPFGTNGDVPVPADYDADGKADFAVLRPSSSTWFISQSSGAPTRILQFGVTGDAPVVADYDGDAKADIGIFRHNGAVGEWWINRSTAGLLAMQFGASTDKAVQGDYTGDGKTDVAMWRPSSGEWFIVRSEDSSFYGFPFGANGDIPSPGDYDGDSKFDPTLFRPSNATWFIARTTSGTQIVQFGAMGDRPIPNAFVP